MNKYLRPYFEFSSDVPNDNLQVQQATHPVPSALANVCEDSFESRTVCKAVSTAWLISIVCLASMFCFLVFSSVFVDVRLSSRFLIYRISSYRFLFSISL